MAIKNLTFRLTRPICQIAQILLVSSIVLLQAKQNEIHFKRLTIEDGLPQNGGYCIAQDNNGFMYIGTEVGLVKYNGYDFVLYENDVKDSTSISNNTPLALCKDKKGYLWVGTEHGLNRFDPKREIFTRYLHSPDNPGSISNNRVYSLFEDSTGCLWVGTEEGLNRFDPEQNSFTTYKHGPENQHSLSENNVRAVYVDRNGTVWAGTYGGGLNRFDQTQGTFICYKNESGNPESLSDNVVLSLCEDSDGALWVGTEKGGLNRFDPDKETFVRFRNNESDPHSISGNMVNVIYEDQLANLWIGTGIGGLNRFNRAKKQFRRYQNRPDDPKSLSFDRVLSIFEDFNGGLWFGTRGGGVNIYYKETHKFIHYKPDPDNKNSLSNKMVWKIFEDSKGIVWIGTDNGGLNKFNRRANTFTHYMHEPQDPYSISYDRVLDICEGPSGVLWVGTNGGGLNRFNPKTERFIHYKHNPDNPNSLCDNRVISLMMDRAGILWIGTRGGGLNTFNPRSGRFTHYKNEPQDPFSISNNRVYAILEDSNGNLWIGTFRGLNRFDRSTRRFTRFMANPDTPGSISDNQIFAICESKNGTIWIATGNSGLNRYNSNNNTFTHFTKKDGLADNVIYAIVEDDKETLWMSTNRGLSNFDPLSGEIKNYDVKDGLQSNEFNALAAYKNNKGELFFGGVNGFNIFHPDSLTEIPHIPPIKITSFKIFNKEVPVGPAEDGRTILTKPITETDEITLTYKENVFSFEFVALHFISPEKNQYAYIMEGLDKEWNDVGTRRFVAYSGLNPGKYVFMVKGSNCDGVWNKEAASIKITITPPFWQTIWFRLLVIAGIIVVAIAWFRSQIDRMRKEEEEKRLRHVTDIFSHALEQGKSAVYRRNFATNEYEYMGNGIKDITGFGADELTPDLFENIILHVETKGEMEGLPDGEAKKRFQEGKNEQWHADIKFTTKTGATRWIMDMSTLLRDGSGRAYGCLGILLDITDRKTAEQNLEKAYKEIEADLNMAREVQMAFLEQNLTRFPEHVSPEKSDLQFYHRYLPATTLAGDFFNILPISKHKVGILICDVMGHGARASLLTAYIQGLMEELMPAAADPGAFVKKLNIGINAIMSQFTTGIFATVFYLVIDTKNGRMSFTNAGHPRPLILRRSEGIVERMQLNGKKPEPALGLFTEFEYSVFTAKAKPDDIILFFTDGIFEVESTGGQLFGKNRLLDSTQKQISKHPNKVLDGIIEEINAFSQSSDFRDDVCLITMHVGHEKSDG